MNNFLRTFRARDSGVTLYDSVRTSEDDLNDEMLEKPGRRIRETKAPIWPRYARLFLAQVALLVVYTVAMYLVAEKVRQEGCDNRSVQWSPAAGAVTWEERKFVLGDRIQEKSKYSGRPSPGLDRAWHDLLNAENIRIEPEIIQKLGREDVSVRVPGEKDFIGTLNVYHELHCLKRLHQYMYQDIYFPDIDDKQREMNRLHNEHCLDFLRQSVMCHGDIGLITYQWSPDNLIPVANATTHQCVNWRKLDDWTKARSVDMMKPGWLVHPTLGLAYPKGEGDKIGAANGGH